MYIYIFILKMDIESIKKQEAGLEPDCTFTYPNQPKYMLRLVK